MTTTSKILSKVRMHARTVGVVSFFLICGYQVFKFGKLIQRYSEGTSYRQMEEMEDFLYNKELQQAKASSSR
uniref:Uncharacterized protein n=1 Tax=Panagrolaimus sp. JU765 TaxID=591449 RepID=A0AC34QGM8_9BILA